MIESGAYSALENPAITQDTVGQFSLKGYGKFHHF